VKADPRDALSGVLDRKSQGALVLQLLKDMPVEDSTTNKPRALAHHVEQNVLSFLTDCSHVS